MSGRLPSPSATICKDHPNKAKLYPGYNFKGGDCNRQRQGSQSADASDVKIRGIENTPPQQGKTEPNACLQVVVKSDSESRGGVSKASQSLPASTAMTTDTTATASSATASASATGDSSIPVMSVGVYPLQSGAASMLRNPHQQKSVEMSSSVCGTGLQVDLPSSVETTDHVDISMSKVPAKALNVPTRTRLSLMLNPRKVLYNDWTGLAGEMGFEYEEIENFEREKDPTKAVLSAWTCKPGSTIGALMTMLQEINRDDVLNEIRKPAERDASRWVERRRGDIHGQPVQDPEVSGSYPNVPETPELRGITLEDHPSGPPEIFDAYVCFTYADSEFVKEMMSVLERDPYSLKLCIDFRDLVPGGSYSTITAELIENRCKRMIIILSPDFLASEDCNFQTKFAHSIAPSARSKRLIPVMVEVCKPPNILRHLTICDYTKTDLRRWFWPRLHSALTKK